VADGMMESHAARRGGGSGLRAQAGHFGHTTAWLILLPLIAAQAPHRIESANLRSASRPGRSLGK
jgi:hypothetical protein